MVLTTPSAHNVDAFAQGKLYDDDFLELSRVLMVYHMAVVMLYEQARYINTWPLKGMLPFVGLLPVGKG